MAPLTLTALVLAVLATLVGAVVLGRGVGAIVRTVRRGGPAGRTDHPGRRTWTVVRTVLGHGRFRHRPAVRVAHWLVMVSFPVLFLTLVAGYGQIVDPGFALPLVGHWAPWEWVTEALAWTSLVGIVWLIVVRLRTQPAAPGAGADAATPEARRSRFFGSNRGQAYFVEAVVLAVVLAVLALRALEHAWLAADPVTAHLATWVHFPGTAWLGALLADVPTATLATAITLTALAKILASMTWMVVVGLRPAMGVSWHRFLAFVTIWARREPDGAVALGPLPPVRAGGREVDFTDLESLPEDARLGAGRIEDFTWKGLLDFSTCTECGRCQEQCPAWNTGKPLSPKLVVMALRDHAYASAPYLRAAANAPTAPAGLTSATGHVPWGPTPAPDPGDGVASGGGNLAVGTGAGNPSTARGDGRGGGSGGVGPGGHDGLDVLTLVGDVIEEDALWDCTMCGACVAQCPVDIEHVDHIADLRRHQVLMESAFPAELGGMFTKLERQGNPWGVPARKRLEWARGLDFPVPVVGIDVASAAEVDYLFWVGCAGAFEDRAKETSRAVAELLHTAGVSFAVLGDGESCTGDPARRAGNEMLYQMLAAANVEALDAAGARRIVVTCAHCFNTLKREYPQLGGRYEVVHHTELLEELVAEGRLVPLTPVATGEPMTYHDPCFLGRHNEIYLPPRHLLGAAGATTVEMPRTGERALCCGGGGARVWMEETRGTRIATDRATEALGTGAGRIVTACPFCTVMLTDGVAAAGGAAEVVDVATVLLDSVRGGGAAEPA